MNETSWSNKGMYVRGGFIKDNKLKVTSNTPFLLYTYIDKQLADNPEYNLCV